MFGLTTSTNLPPEILLSCADMLLAIDTPNLIHGLAAKRDKLPAKGGTTLRYSRYSRLPKALVPIVGVPVSPVIPERTDIDATISVYGLYVAINQMVVLQNQDRVLAEISELLGLSMRMTEDTLIRDNLMSSATVYNATGGTNGDLPTDISLSDINKITTALLGANAWMIMEKKEGRDRFGRMCAEVKFSLIDLEAQA